MILLFVQPLLILAALIFKGRGPREMVEVVVLRVQDSAGRTSEARIEREMRGAGVRLGDSVALWGHFRGSLLYVRGGFNHTTGAELRLGSGSSGGSGPGIAGRVVLIVLAAIIILFVLSLIISALS